MEVSLTIFIIGGIAMTIIVLAVLLTTIVQQKRSTFTRKPFNGQSKVTPNELYRVASRNRSTLEADHQRVVQQQQHNIAMQNICMAQMHLHQQAAQMNRQNNSQM